MNCREVCPFVLQCQQVAASLAEEVQEIQAEIALNEADETVSLAEIKLAAHYGVVIDPDLAAKQAATRDKLNTTSGNFITSVLETIAYNTKIMNDALANCNGRGPRKKLGWFTVRKVCQGQ